MIDKAITVRNLTKNFYIMEREPGIVATFKSLFKKEKKKISAVQSISFDVNAGEITGFIGQNGAGKTTTIKMLTGTLYPTTGQISVAGFNPIKRSKEFRKKISVVMGNKPQMMMDLTPGDYFDLLQDMYGINRPEFQKTIINTSKLLNIENRLNVQARKLSLGERMKVEFIAAIATKPEVLFLDEPTIGLDVIAKRDIRDFLTAINAMQNITIILTSHDMEDIAAVCKKVILLNHGQIIWQGELVKLMNYFKDYRYLSFLKTSNFKQEKICFPIVNNGKEKITLKVPKHLVNQTTMNISNEGFGTEISVHKLELNDVVIEFLTGSGKNP